MPRRGSVTPGRPTRPQEQASLWGVCLKKEFRSPSRHGDLTAAEDLKFKLEELREATDWKIPIGVKIPQDGFGKT